jgi:hypothetical protein
MILHLHLLNQKPSKSIHVLTSTNGYRKKLAADIAKSAQTVKPSEDDIVIANMRYARAQRAADDAYERTYNVERVNRRWKKRDD